MKLFLVAPVVPSELDKKTANVRFRNCIEPIADLILSHLQDDPALFGMRHKGEASKPPLPTTETFGYAEIVRLADKVSLRAVLLECGDPSSGQWMLIRSLITCRAVFYGYDGQAFVCLPHEAPPILTPDADMINVVDVSEMLAGSDYMDGLRSD